MMWNVDDGWCHVGVDGWSWPRCRCQWSIWGLTPVQPMDGYSGPKNQTVDFPGNDCHPRKVKFIWCHIYIYLYYMFITYIYMYMYIYDRRDNAQSVATPWPPIAQDAWRAEFKTIGPVNPGGGPDLGGVDGEIGSHGSHEHQTSGEIYPLGKWRF